MGNYSLCVKSASRWNRDTCSLKEPLIALLFFTELLMREKLFVLSIRSLLLARHSGREKSNSWNELSHKSKTCTRTLKYGFHITVLLLGQVFKIYFLLACLRYRYILNYLLTDLSFIFISVLDIIKLLRTLFTLYFFIFYGFFYS